MADVIQLLVFEEQMNFAVLKTAFVGGVKYIDESAGTPLGKLVARRYFRIGSTQQKDKVQDSELNDLCVNNPSFNTKFLVDFQVHESNRRSRLSLLIDDGAGRAGIGIVPLSKVRFRSWEEVIRQGQVDSDAQGTGTDPANGQTPWLAVEESHKNVPQRLALTTYIGGLSAGQLNQQAVLLPTGGAAYGTVPAAADPPARAIVAHRVHCVGGLTRIVTCEFTNASVAANATLLP